jgi:hypothetical protein
LLALLPATSEGFGGCLIGRIQENARNRAIVDMLGQRIYYIQPTQPQQPPQIIQVIPQIIGNLPIDPGSGQFPGQFPIQPGSGQFPIQPPSQSVQQYQWTPALILQSNGYGGVTPVYRYIPVLR